MLTEYMNDHAHELHRELREISQSRRRYDRVGDGRRSWVRDVVRGFALPAIKATPGSGGQLPEVVIRPAAPDDGPMLARLAEASERRFPSGLVLVAEVESQLVAALPVEASYVLTDLRRPTADVVQLLQLRCDQLSAAKVA